MEKLFQGFEKAFEKTFLDPTTAVGAFFYAFLFFLAAFITARMLQAAIDRLIKRSAFDPASLHFAAQLGRISIFLFAFVFYAHLIPALRQLGTAMLASIGVFSIVVGLAAQATLGNLIAGVSLLLYRPFRIGDRLQVMAPGGFESGTVESLTLGYTVLHTLDNRRIVVPNSVMASQITVNLTMRDPRLIIEIPITVGYGSDLDRVRAILLELAGAHPRVQGVEDCPVVEHGNYGVKLLLRVWCQHHLDGRIVTFDLLEATKKRFDAEGIEIPFPYTNVIFRGGSMPSAAPSDA